MKDIKKLPIPKWNVWIVFVVFVISSFAYVGWMGLSFINNPQLNTGGVLGFILFSVLSLYVFLIVPSMIMWDYLRR